MNIPEAATEATAIHLFQVDRRLKGLTPVDWKHATDFERTYFRAEALLALEAAMPAIRQHIANEIHAALCTDPNCEDVCVGAANAVEVVLEGFEL